jgi:hypothetical protein
MLDSVAAAVVAVVAVPAIALAVIAASAAAEIPHAMDAVADSAARPAGESGVGIGGLLVT